MASKSLSFTNKDFALFNKQDVTIEIVKDLARVQSFVNQTLWKLSLISGLILLAFGLMINQGVRRRFENVRLQEQKEQLNSANIELKKEITDRKLAEEKNIWDQQSKTAMSNLLETSLEPLHLYNLLESALRILLELSWLSIQSKGSIFLIDRKTEELVLTVQQGLSKQILHSCARIKPGHCLCGRVVKSHKVIFASHINELHDVQYDGMKPHGHYCIPIISKERLLGVINLYVNEGHQHNYEEENFLVSIANTLAGLIERKMVEEKLHLAKKITEENNKQLRIEISERKKTAKKLIEKDELVQISNSLSTGCNYFSRSKR